MTATDQKQWWLRRVRRLALRVNIGWWLERFLPAAAVLALFLAVAILILRRSEVSLQPLVPVGAVLAVAVAAGCWLAARRKFDSLCDARVRIEAENNFHNGLTMAAEGRAEWPEEMPTLPKGMQWRWRKLIPPGVALAVVVVAALVPIDPQAAPSPNPVQEPLAWKELEEWLDTLEEKTVVDPEPLQKLREDIRQLRAQPKEEWYSHSSLEAGDSLREQTASSLQELQRNLESARAAVEALSEQQDSLSVQSQEAFRDFLSKTIEGLRNSSLSLDPALLKQLEKIDPSSLRALTDAEWKALEEALKKGYKACKACNKKGDGTNLVACVSMCQSWCTGARITRGPGPAPLFMAENETHLGTTRSETLPAAGFERAALGDTLAVGEGEHEIDETAYRGPQRAGDATQTGQGGDTVWRQPLTPGEQAVLEDYFQ